MQGLVSEEYPKYLIRAFTCTEVSPRFIEILIFKFCPFLYILAELIKLSSFNFDNDVSIQAARWREHIGT